MGCEKIIDLDRQCICSLCKGTKSRLGYSSKDCNSCKGAGIKFQRNGNIMSQVECEDCEGEGIVMRNPCLY